MNTGILFFFYFLLFNTQFTAILIFEQRFNVTYTKVTMFFFFHFFIFLYSNEHLNYCFRFCILNDGFRSQNRYCVAFLLFLLPLPHIFRFFYLHKIISEEKKKNKTHTKLYASRISLFCCVCFFFVFLFVPWFYWWKICLNRSFFFLFFRCIM